MAKYLMIESRDSFESNDVANYYEIASGLAKSGNEVTVFLVQNGVLPARATSKMQGLVDLAKSGVTVLADDFSLRERGNGYAAEAAVFQRHPWIPSSTRWPTAPRRCGIRTGRKTWLTKL